LIYNERKRERRKGINKKESKGERQKERTGGRKNEGRN